jgi:hypothetical protein
MSRGAVPCFRGGDVFVFAKMVFRKLYDCSASGRAPGGLGGIEAKAPEHSGAFHAGLGGGQNR